MDESYNQIQSLVQSNKLRTEIYLAREISAHNIQNKPVLFFEHYPLPAKETEIIEKLQLKEASFYSSLDESLFKYFNGDHLISMMEKLGLSENESIGHLMITNAIKNSQEQLSKQILIEHFAPSQTEWFSKNIVK